MATTHKKVANLSKRDLDRAVKSAVVVTSNKLAGKNLVKHMKAGDVNKIAAMLKRGSVQVRIK